MNKRTPDEKQMQELLTLGAEGKLWAVSVVYKVGAETKHYDRRNMTGEQTMQMRSRIFQFGFEIMQSPGHWQIICPMDILEVHMFKQTRYVPEGAPSFMTHVKGQPNG